jgi:hypothetical protein
MVHGSRQLLLLLLALAVRTCGIILLLLACNCLCFPQPQHSAHLRSRDNNTRQTCVTVANIMVLCSLFLPPRWGAGPMALKLWLNLVI